MGENPMARFLVVHQLTGERWEVEAVSAEGAREVVGWPVGDCSVAELLEGPFAEIIPPQIAKQVSLPKPGSSHICPECEVSMIEFVGAGEFWWQCPSCDLLYQEWENRFYKSDEL
jgi:rubredoxin